jgi:hypothetical protein
MASVQLGGSILRPDPGKLQAGWEDEAEIPTVRVSWEALSAKVVERFFCPDTDEPLVAREISLQPLDPAAEILEKDSVTLRIGSIAAEPGQTSGTAIHRIRRQELQEGADRGKVGAAPHLETLWAETVSPTSRQIQYWNRLTTCRTSDPDLDHLFQVARNHLPTAVDNRGRMDGSIWQYNLEWVRDQAHVAEALARLGDHERSRIMLARLLDEFVSPEGDTVDSGRCRPPADVELDQNGELLVALGSYVDWTGDLELVDSRWEKIRSLAAFPFSPDLTHDRSGLLHNRREYWERHRDHGIQDGFELMSQFFVALGLQAAGRLAGALDQKDDQARWVEAAEALRRAMLEDPVFRLVEEGHLIKRRGTDGSWQKAIEMDSNLGLPLAIPLLQEGPHLLDPDTSSVLPVVHGFVDPQGALARGTLAHVEELWNQWWDGGGYGRYHASSEPDSPGAWPFASLFVARAYAESGQDEMAWRILRWLAATPGGASGTWFENDGPRIAPPYPQVGITPWTWAELITLFVHHLLGVRPDLEGLTLRPVLLDGLQGMEASVPVRNHRVHLRCRAAGGGEEKGAWVQEDERECSRLQEGESGRQPADARGPTSVHFPWREKGVRIPIFTSDLHVEVLC